MTERWRVDPFPAAVIGVAHGGLMSLRNLYMDPRYATFRPEMQPRVDALEDALMAVTQDPSVENSRRAMRTSMSLLKYAEDVNSQSPDLRRSITMAMQGTSAIASILQKLLVEFEGPTRNLG